MLTVLNDVLRIAARVGRDRPISIYAARGETPHTRSERYRRAQTERHHLPF